MEWCPVLETFLLLDHAQSLQPLPSTKIGLQPLVLGSVCSGVGWWLDGVRFCYVMQSGISETILSSSL